MGEKDFRVRKVDMSMDVNDNDDGDDDDGGVNSGSGCDVYRQREK